MNNGLYRQPNVNTWHWRGGLQGYGQTSPATLNYGIDEDGNLYPLVYGNDAAGNPVLITEANQIPWQGQVVQSLAQTVGGIFGSGGYRPAYSSGRDFLSQDGYRAPGPTPGGLASGLGISTQSLWLIGIAAVVFLYGKGKR